jgi:tRNA/rRNA methyltransferase
MRPTIAANVGATARIMRNMGLSDLVLVEPECDRLDRSALQLSTHGESILHAARIANSFETAVADCSFVVGTSARAGGPFRGQSMLRPASAAEKLLAALASGAGAIVFGPEPSGLTNDEITRCHFLVNIPSDEGYPALNLAQAVAICLYELRRAWLEGHTASPVAETAPFAEQDRMFAALEEGLRAVHFLFGTSQKALMHSLRHLIGRARPTRMEIGVLHGLARQLHWCSQWLPSHAIDPLEGADATLGSTSSDVP